MSLLSEYSFAFQKKESFYLLFLVLIVYFLTGHTSFSSRHIVLFVPAAIIGYIYYTRTVDANYAKMHLQNEKLGKIDIAAYPHLQSDIEVIDTMIQLESLFSINRLQYMEVMKRLNRFFEIYRDMKDGTAQGRSTDLYWMAKENSKMAFNALLSYAIQIDSVNDRKQIERAIEHLKRRCQLILNEMESAIQKKWNDGEVDIHSQPIYPDEPEPSVFGDVQFSKHYNIY